MPWKDVNAMELRIRFIADWLKKTHTVIGSVAISPLRNRSAGFDDADHEARL